MLQIDTNCEKCGNRYTNIEDKWCKPCQINDLKKNFINWTSGNEIIDDLIQEKQQNIYGPNDTVFEWIPYNQLNNKEMIIDNFYSAIWKDGPLYYCHNKKAYVRKSGNRKIIFEYLYNSLIITNEFLDEV